VKDEAKEEKKMERAVRYLAAIKVWFTLLLTAGLLRSLQSNESVDAGSHLAAVVETIECGTVQLISVKL